MSGPLSETLRAGLSGSYLDQDPVLDNTFTGEGINEASRYSVRGQLVAEPTDALKLRLIASHAELLDSKGGGERDFYYGNAPRALNAAFGVPCADNDPTNRVVCRNFGGDVSLESSEATLIATYEFAGGTTFTSLSSWDEYETLKVLDADQLNISVADFNDRQAGDSLQQELRLASATGGALDWLLGAFYYEANFERGNFPGKDTFVLGAQAPLVPLAPGLPVGQPGQAGSLAVDDRYGVRRRVRTDDMARRRSIRTDRRSALADGEQGHEREPHRQSRDAVDHHDRVAARDHERRSVARDRCRDLVGVAAGVLHAGHDGLSHGVARLQVRRVQRRLG